MRRFSTAADVNIKQKSFNPEYSGPKKGIGSQGVLPGNMGKIIYNNLIKSVPMYGTAILGAAIVFDLVFDGVTDNIWALANRYLHATMCNVLYCDIGFDLWMDNVWTCSLFRRPPPPPLSH
jgi:hypothetical protein